MLHRDNPSVTAFAVPAPFTQGSLIFVHQRPFLRRSEDALRQMKSKFCVIIYPFHQPLRAWSPSPSKRGRLPSVRQRSFLHPSKGALRQMKSKFCAGTILQSRHSPCQLPLHKGALRLCANVLYYIVQKNLGCLQNLSVEQPLPPLCKGRGTAAAGEGLFWDIKILFILSRMTKKRMSDAQAQARP